MFVFYLFTPPPMLFNPVHESAVRESARAGEYLALEQRFNETRWPCAGQPRSNCRCRRPRPAPRAFRDAEQRGQAVRAEAVALVKQVSGDNTYNDAARNSTG